METWIIDQPPLFYFVRTAPPGAAEFIQTGFNRRLVKEDDRSRSTRRIWNESRLSKGAAEVKPRPRRRFAR
jgi:hypothetical protein